MTRKHAKWNYLVKTKLGYVIEGTHVVVVVLQLYLEVPLVLLVSLGQVERVSVKACLSANLNRYLHVEVNFTIFRLQNMNIHICGCILSPWNENLFAQWYSITPLIQTGWGPGLSPD